MQILNDSRDFQWAMEGLRKKRRKGRLVYDWDRAQKKGLLNAKLPEDPLYHSKRLYRFKHTPIREWEIFDGVSTKKRFSIKRENELVNDVMYLILSGEQTKGLVGRIYKKYKLDKDDLPKIKAMVQKEFCYPELLQYKDTAKECFRPSWLDLEKVKRAEKKSRSKDIAGKEYKKKFGYYPSGVVKKKPKELASRTDPKEEARPPAPPVLPLVSSVIRC